MEYLELWDRIEKLLSLTKTAVLATASKEGIVTSSKMCMVSIGPKVYFQTCASFEKTQNIRENPHVAITLNNVYFKGLAKIIGHPLEYPEFVKLLKEKHPSTYECYTNLENQVLIEIELTECRIWGFWQDNDNNSKEEAIKVLDLKNKSIDKITCDNLSIK